MKKILIFAPKSSHTAKFLEMIDDKVDYYLVADNTYLNIIFKRPYTKNNQRSIKGILTILKFLWFSKYDYIHVHTINLTAFIVSIFARKPIIVTAWGSDVLLVPKRSVIHKAIVKFIIRKASLVTSANDACNINAAICDLVPGTNVKGLHFAVSHLSKRTNLSKKENIIYSPRGHSDLYNVDKIIEAFRKFSPDHPSWELIISGVEHPVNTPKLKEKAKGLPVTFPGFVSPEENAKFNARAKIMVSIPSSDALSVSLMDAIYSNCICFVSDLPTNRQVITDGVNGFVDNLDLSLYKQIKDDVLEKENAKLSKIWDYNTNKKKFIELYDSIRT